MIRSEGILYANPEATVRGLLAFLGESWASGLLDGPPPRGAGRKRSTAIEASLDERAIRGQLANNLERYGYDATCP